jgi:large subunit ribosomal protein L10
MIDWTKKGKAIEIGGAFVDGQVFDGEGVDQLSKMPTRAELQGQIIAAFRSPGARVAGAAMGPARAIAGCIKTIIENAEKQAA